MHQLNNNSIIESIGEFFSELSPQALALIVGICTAGLYVVGGLLIAFIVGLLALGVTKFGPIIISLCGLLLAGFSMYVFFKAVLNYKKIILSYENHNT